MSKSYRVHVHDHADQGRWLAQADFARMPKTEDLPASLPVLNEPGRYEVNINVVHGDDEQRLLSYLTGEPWVRSEQDGKPGWFLEGHGADPGWFVSDEWLRMDRDMIEKQLGTDQPLGLPPLPEEAWQVNCCGNCEGTETHA